MALLCILRTSACLTGVGSAEQWAFCSDNRCANDGVEQPEVGESEAAQLRRQVLPTTGERHDGGAELAGRRRSVGRRHRARQKPPPPPFSESEPIRRSSRRQCRQLNRPRVRLGCIPCPTVRSTIALSLSLALTHSSHLSFRSLLKDLSVIMLSSKYLRALQPSVFFLSMSSSFEEKMPCYYCLRSRVLFVSATTLSNLRCRIIVCFFDLLYAAAFICCRTLYMQVEQRKRR